MTRGTLERAPTLPSLWAPSSSVPTLSQDMKRLWQFLRGPDPRMVEQGLIADELWVPRRWPLPGRKRLWEYNTQEELDARAERFHAKRQADYLRLGFEKVLGEYPDVRIPLNYGEDHAEIRLELPLTFLGMDDARAVISELVRKRLGGKWRTTWAQDTFPPFATFVRLPPPGHPPDFVEWALSEDPWQIYVGQSFEGPEYVNIRTQTPHFGVTAGTGGGKTTLLALPVTHARMAMGALVDIIDLKEDSFDAYFDGMPGIRIHRSAESAVMAVAEFFTSIKGLRTAKLKGYDISHVPPRFLVLDELGSFILAAETWWKYGIQGKGAPPFLAMFNMCLMQGRTKNHRIVVGTHQFSLANFKSTDARDLIGTKIAVGPCSAPKWATTFGLDTPRIKYNDLIPGRGVIGITGSGGSVKEIQLAYLTPETAQTHLAKLDAPAWFDNGEMAPWIDADAIELATREGFAGPFLPGGDFITPGLSLVPGKAPLQLLPAIVRDTTAPTVALPSVREPVTLREAADRGIISTSYDTAKKARQRSIERDDGSFPAHCGKRRGAFLFEPMALEYWDQTRDSHD